MDLDVPRTTLAERFDMASPMPFPATQAELLIHRLLANAEQLIRQQRPAQALDLLQAPGTPPLTWPLPWHPRWYLLAAWALIEEQHPPEAGVLLEQGLAVLSYLLRCSPDAEQVMLYEWR